MFGPDIETITALEVAARLTAGASATETLQLIDVREPVEVEIAAIAGFENLPLSAYAEWSATICQRFNPELETLVLCHHGIRSAQMCHWLQGQGFARVKNILGGIDAWSLTVNSEIPRY